MSLQWIHYPLSQDPPVVIRDLVEVVAAVYDRVRSPDNRHDSNTVLEALSPGLQKLGFVVEEGKKSDQKILVPVLFGRNGETVKAFEADAYLASEGLVLEVEAGRAVANNQFLKDLFQACMMRDVRQLAIAVRNEYEGGGRVTRDFDAVAAFFDTLYASNRLKLPLEGVTIIGY